MESENRLRELVNSVGNSNKSFKDNGFSYTDIIVDYLAKALEYYKRDLPNIKLPKDINELLRNDFENATHTRSREDNGQLSPGKRIN